MRTAALSIVFLLVFSVFADAEGPKETTRSISDGQVGKRVASFEGETTTGKKLSSENFGGGVLIINLWGLSCGSCLDEMKAFEPIYREYKDQGLKIWAVNTEDIGARQIQEGLAARNIHVSYDLLVDPGLEITRNFTSWFIPVTVIVDRDGMVQYYKIGFNQADAEKIKAKVGALLAQ
jgi:peroxiredoxin